MVLELPTLILLLLAAASLMLALAIYAWRRRSMPGAGAFSALMAISVLWAIASALEAGSQPISAKLFWANVQFICYALIPLIWLNLVLQFTGKESWLTPSRMALLLIVPLLTILFAWTNGLHGLIRQDIYLDTSGAFPVIGKTFGPWTYVHTLYSYALIAVAIYLSIRGIQQSPTDNRSQIIVLLAGLLAPLTLNTIYILRIFPFLTYDLAPVFLSVTGVVMTWGLFRLHIFDILPMAYDALLVGMRDGVVVLDSRREVAALNPAAEQILNWSGPEVIGRPAQDAFRLWPAVLRLLASPEVSRTELAVRKNDTERTYDMSISPLLDPYHRKIGELVIFHDVTASRLIQEELRALSITDPLTGLFNRRKFFESLSQELQRARRYEQDLALIVMDVKGLKRINDTYGHLAGDEALQHVGKVIRRLRRTDLAARFGGDEFVILLPSTSTEGAAEVAERILAAVSRDILRYGGNVAINMGIAALAPEDDDEGRSLLDRADQAMYRAKQAGQGFCTA